MRFFEMLAWRWARVGLAGVVGWMASGEAAALAAARADRAAKDQPRKELKAEQMASPETALSLATAPENLDRQPGVGSGRAEAQRVSLRGTWDGSWWHDRREGPVRLAGTARAEAVRVRVTTVDGESSVARVPVAGGHWSCRYPDDFVGAPGLKAGWLGVDATTGQTFAVDTAGGEPVEGAILVHGGKEEGVRLPGVFTTDLLDGSGGRDRTSRTWPAARLLANHYLRSRGAKLAGVGRPDFDLAREADLAWFKDHLSLYEFDYRDRDWSRPLGARVARTFWQAVWDRWFNASNDHPLDGNPANRDPANFLPYTFANDFADILIMEWMRAATLEPDGKWSIYPNVDAMAVAALAQGAQYWANKPGAARWRKTAKDVADGWLAAAVDSGEWAGPIVHFGLRQASGRMTYVWPGANYARIFYSQTGHWIHALADLYALTGVERYRERAEAMVKDLLGANPWQVRLLTELGGVYNWSDDMDRDGVLDRLRLDLYPESTAFCQIGIWRLGQARLAERAAAPSPTKPE